MPNAAPPPCAALAAVALLAACDASRSVDASRHVRGTMRLAVASALDANTAWDLARARLVVTPAGGAPTQTMLTGIDPGNTEATFDVAVPAGSTRFRAEVLSNRDTVLLDGEATEDVQRDGFRVEVPIAVRRPVLLASPASLVLAPRAASDFSFSATLVVTNPGRGTLVVRVDPASTALTGCNNGPCVFVLPASTNNAQSYSVVPGQPLTLTVATSRLLSASQPLTLRLVAPEGTADVTVRGTAP